MRTMSKLFLVLVLAVAACRSVPRDVADAHQITKTEGEAAMVLASDTLTKIETKSEELNDASVDAAFEEWQEHLNAVLEARAVVTKYLNESKAGDDVTKSYAVAQQLLLDMHGGFIAIDKYWQQMLLEERAADAERFVTLFRKDIARYRELMRKFDEWISQFRVKG